MPPEEYSDDYVANLLKQDAKLSAAKYATAGLEAYLPQSSRRNAPKPNTRFLNNIIRQADNHNAALFAKESRDARERLRGLRKDNLDGSSRDSSGDNERKRRHDEHESRHRRDGDRRRHEPDWSRSHDTQDDSDYSRRRSRKHHETEESRRKYRRTKERSRTPDGDRRHRRQHRSEREKDSRRRSRSRSSSRSRSPEPGHHRRRRSRTDRGDGDRSSHRIDGKGVSRTGSSPVTRTRPTSNDDPLEALIGPMEAPKVQPRGRGNFRSSAMDSHFAADYDPSADVRADSDMDDDWDMALEALRDGQKWKQQGAERLRSAGFSEEQVRRWERGGEMTEEDVRWAKKGEGREWDRGKVVDDDGHVSVRASWI